MTQTSLEAGEAAPRPVRAPVQTPAQWPLASADPAAVARRLEAVRERTLSLIAVVDWPTLRRQLVPILSPMVWDLGHIGNFEELWLCRQLAGRRSLADGYERMFDAVANPRPTREGLPLPAGHQLYRYLAQVRERSLAAVAAVASSPDRLARPELAAGGYIFELVAEHEEQHQETLLQAMQLMDDPPYSPAQRRRLPAGRPGIDDEEMVEIAAGPFEMGCGEPGAAPGTAGDGHGFAYDNERARHTVELPAFRIDRFPVSNRRYLAFVEEGGYRRRELWSEAGWAWLEEAGVEAPAGWRRGGDGSWQLRSMDRERPLPLDRPVCHICFHEAEAFARFAGRRLPTEAEWEKAALGRPGAVGRPGGGGGRPYPWGDRPPDPGLANLDQLAFEPAPLGAYPDGASAHGVEQLIGDVWEWTSSPFTAYPGFAAYPYDEYSQIFFGDEYRVLRGGSWATRPAVARGTFRNWDLPIRRQIFAGLRCAADV